MKTDVLLKTEDRELSPLLDDAIRYVLAANGAYLERAAPGFATSTRVVGDVPGLAEHFQYCRLTCGKLNRTLHAAMLSFFQHAHRLHGGEAALVLLYHPERRAFRWLCPEQTIEVYESRGYWWAYDYIQFQTPLSLPEGYLIFGDAHLHPGAAYPSAVDTKDDQDGLHIIVGGINGRPQYHVDFVMDGVRFNVRESLIFEEPECRPGPRPPNAWLERIRVVTRQAAAPANPPAKTTGGPIHEA